MQIFLRKNRFCLQNWDFLVFSRLEKCLFEMIVALKEEVVVRIALYVNGFDAFVDDLAQLVDVRLVSCAYKHRS